VLGAGGVIAGWDQGLVGVQQGGRRQLDIPADLAYGDTPQGDIIQPGDALTFVVDVVAVIPAADPADAPTGTVAATPNGTELRTTDITVGTGAALETGKHAVVHIVAYRADTGAEINSTWTSGSAFDFVFGTGDAIPGVGGRREVLIPFAQAFGDAGSEGLGLPPSTDLVIVVDLIATY
jgi:peptidylprolyl isomerase